jgi:hypothetical protein
MTTQIREDRYKLIASLPDDWLEIIHNEHVGEGAYPMSIYPDEATIYNGDDDELAAVLEKYGWNKLK